MSTTLVVPSGTEASILVCVTKKLSISLPDDLEYAARFAAEAAGLPLSTWLAHAVREALTHQEIVAAGRAAIEEDIRENGPIVVTEEEEAWVNAVLADAGLLPDPQHREAS